MQAPGLLQKLIVLPLPFLGGLPVALQLPPPPFLPVVGVERPGGAAAGPSRAGDRRSSRNGGCREPSQRA